MHHDGIDVKTYRRIDALKEIQMEDALLIALRKIADITHRAIAEYEAGEDLISASAEIRKSLPRGAGKEYVRPIISEFAPNDPFVTADVEARARDRYPNYRISEQTVRRALNDFAEEGLLVKVGTGWKVKSKLKSVSA